MARILVVQDDGHAADAVYSGRAALDRLAGTVYDLIVCDVRMPDVDGKAVFQAVAQLGPSRPIVLFMTGYGDAPTESDFLHTTAAVALAKPLGIDALLERVRCLLNPAPRPGASR